MNNNHKLFAIALNEIRDVSYKLSMVNSNYDHPFNIQLHDEWMASGVAVEWMSTTGSETHAWHFRLIGIFDIDPSNSVYVKWIRAEIQNRKNPKEKIQFDLWSDKSVRIEEAYNEWRKKEDELFQTVLEDNNVPNLGFLVSAQPTVQVGDHIEITFKFPHHAPIHQGDVFSVQEVRRNGDITVAGSTGFPYWLRASDYKIIAERAAHLDNQTETTD